MKILHLLPTLQRRGAQMFAQRLMAGLNQRGGCQQSLAVLHPGPNEVGLCDLVSTLHELPQGSWVCKVFALRHLFDSARPNVIVAHGGESLKFAVLARGRAALPAIVYRKIGLTQRWLGPLRPFKLPLQRWLLKRADAISAVGEAARQEAIDLFHADPSRLRVIYNGFDPSLYDVTAGTRERVRHALGLPAAARVLISVGSLGWKKNQAAMLRAMVAVRQAQPNAMLLLVGDGPLRSTLEGLADQLGVRDAVRFLGMRKDVPELLAAADTLVLTSLTEGVPGVLIEAGIAGLPCVSWDVAGAGEVILHEETGLVTPYQDEAVFVASVLRLLDDAALAARFGEAARQRCRSRFSISATVSAHFDLIKQVSHDTSR